MKIWCVEDDSSIRDIEVYTLNSTGFAARGFADGAAFRAALETEEPDLVVLDVMLPGESGVELLQFLRGNPATAEIPIIMATAKGMEYDKIQSLDLGADDYLVKPFGMMEMVSRIKAILRRYKPAQVQHVRKAGGLVINLDEYTVTADGERVTLTHTRSRSTARVSRLRIKNLNSCACFCPIRASRSRATSSLTKSGASIIWEKPALSMCISVRCGKSWALMAASSKRCAESATVWRYRHEEKNISSNDGCGRQCAARQSDHHFRLFI